MRFSHLSAVGTVDRWPATPKGARVAPHMPTSLSLSKLHAGAKSKTGCEKSS